MNKKTKKTVMLIVLILLILGVGYAFFNSNLSINGSTTVLNNNFSVIFTNLKEKEGSVTATTPAAIIDEGKTSVTFDVTLESIGDYYGFSIDIKNDGTLNAMVDNISMTELTEVQQKYLTYEVVDTLGMDIRKKDLLKLGETRTINVLIKYKDEPEAYPTEIEEKLQLSFSIDYVESDKTAIEPSLRVGDRALFPNIQAVYSDLSEQKGVILGATGWAYRDFDALAGKTITRIDIPVISVKSLTTDQCMTMKVFEKSSFVLGSPSTLKRTKKVCITPEQLSKYDSTTINDYIMVDIEDETIALDEFVAFGSGTDEITFAYITSPPEDLRIYTNVREVNGKASEEPFGMLIDLYVDNSNGFNPFASKTLSILGDSISTFEGYSNNTDYNSTLLGTPWYSVDGTMYDMTSVNDTWWMQTINELGMTLNVNNSISGSRVFATSNAGYNRAVELDNNDDVNPDIVALWMGINDVRDALESIGTFEAINFGTLKTKDSYITPTTFAEAYAITVDKILTKYKGVDVYCFTLLPAAGNPTQEDLIKVNDIIRKIADKYDVNIVDLYNDSGITYENYSTYLGDGLHPKAAGMDAITQTFVNKLKDEYGVK